MTTPTTRRLAVGTVALGLVLAGTGLGVAAASEPVTHTVTIDATDYAPKSLTVRAGDTIVWVNEDLFPHTVTAEDGSFDSGAIAGGKSWTLTVTAKGDLAYKCIYHRTMVGTLSVE